MTVAVPLAAVPPLLPADVAALHERPPSGRFRRAELQPSRTRTPLPRGPPPAQRPQRREGVVRDFACPHQIPERVEDLALPGAARGRGKLAVEGRAALPQPLAQTVVDIARGSLRLAAGRQIAQRLTAGPVQDDAAVVAAETPPPHPRDFAQSAEFVEEPRLVSGDPNRQNVPFQHRCRDRDAGELIDCLRQPFEGCLGPQRRLRVADRPNPLPGRQEPSQNDLIDRFDLTAQPGERAAAELPQDLRVAPFALRAARPELPAQDRARLQQPLQGLLDARRRHRPARAPARPRGTARGCAPIARRARPAPPPPARGTPPECPPAAPLRERRGSAPRPRSRSSAPRSAMRMRHRAP